MVQMGSAVIGGAGVVPDATTLRSAFLPVVPMDPTTVCCRNEILDDSQSCVRHG